MYIIYFVNEYFSCGDTKIFIKQSNFLESRNNLDLQEYNVLNFRIRRIKLRLKIIYLFHTIKE